eukprot:9890659-Alexandrium_andersonii.AAC.1
MPTTWRAPSTPAKQGAQLPSMLSPPSSSSSRLTPRTFPLGSASTSRSALTMLPRSSSAGSLARRACPR